MLDRYFSLQVADGMPDADLARLSPDGTIHRWDPDSESWVEAQNAFGMIFDVGSQEISPEEAANVTGESLVGGGS